MSTVATAGVVGTGVVLVAAALTLGGLWLLPGGRLRPRRYAAVVTVTVVLLVAGGVCGIMGGIVWLPVLVAGVAVIVIVNAVRLLRSAGRHD